MQQTITQDPPSQSIINMMKYFLDKGGEEKRNQAGTDAKQQNFTAALENVRNGIDQLEKAFKLLNLH